MYSRPSTSQIRAPSARATTSGVVATPRATYRSRSATTRSLSLLVASVTICSCSSDIGDAPFDDPVVPPGIEHALEERLRIERLRPANAGAAPRPFVQQLEGDDGIDRGLPNDGLTAVLAHRLLVVGDVVQVDRTLVAVPVRAGNEGSGARLSGHPLAERGRVRQRRGDHIARRDLDVSDAERLRRIEAEQMQRTQHVDELVAEAVLERHAAAIHFARDEHHLLVLDVDAFDRADSLRKVEDLGLRERLRRIKAAVALPDQRRIEALLDRRPDREGRRERVALD